MVRESFGGGSRVWVVAWSVATAIANPAALGQAQPLSQVQRSSSNEGASTDGVAAVVGAYSGGQDVDLILLSDVDLVARIALTGAEGGSASIGALPLPSGLLASALERLLGEVLIAREAERVRIQPPTEPQVAAEVVRIEEEAGGAAQLAALLVETDASPEEIEVLARRRALVASFLEANLEGTTSITDAEVEATYESGEHPFADASLEQVRESLRAWLAQSAVRRAVRRWVGVLRGRVPLQILVEYQE